MIGEMRDVETCGAGIEASLTGHLVFSTLHTNNAPETVTRLLDLGIDPFTFGDSLLGVLAQRLLRTLCKSCKQDYSPDKDTKTRRVMIRPKPEVDNPQRSTFRAKEEPRIPGP